MLIRDIFLLKVEFQAIHIGWNNLNMKNFSPIPWERLYLSYFFCP